MSPNDHNGRPLSHSLPITGAESASGNDPTNPLNDGTEDGQCSDTTRRGIRCRAKARIGSVLCFFHDPALTNERAVASKRGGEKKHCAVLPPHTPDFLLNSAQDAEALLGRTINQVLRGEIDPRIANTVGYLITLKLKAADTGELERRVAALEGLR